MSTERIYLEPREWLDTAIIGLYKGKNVYELQRLIKRYAEHFLSVNPSLGADAYEDAAEFVDYNTIPSLPYMGELAPFVVAAVDDFDADELEGDPEIIVVGGKLWEVLC